MQGHTFPHTVTLNLHFSAATLQQIKSLKKQDFLYSSQIKHAKKRIFMVRLSFLTMWRLRGKKGGTEIPLLSDVEAEATSEPLPSFPHSQQEDWRPKRAATHCRKGRTQRSSCVVRTKGNSKGKGMSKNQKEVKKIQSVYLQNLEKLNKGIKQEKKSWKPKEGDFAVQIAMEKLRQPPKAGQVAKSSANRISRDLTCSICLDLFKQPVSLPCDHTFCLGCIEGYWAGPRGPGQGGTGSCPQCRKVYPGQSYRPNRIVANIVESYCHGLEESGTGACLADVGVTERVPAPVPRCSRHREELISIFCLCGRATPSITPSLPNYRSPHLEWHH